MALVTKNDVTQIFAIQAPSIDLPPTFANYPRGWDTARDNNGKPTIKQFNYIQQRTDQNVLWIHQNGAALPYDATMEYAENAHVVKDGELQKKQGASWVNVSVKTDSELNTWSGRTQEQKNKDIVSSLDFGLIPNTTIDPLKMQEFFNGGKTLRLEVGVYKCVGSVPTLTLSSQTTLLAYGAVIDFSEATNTNTGRIRSENLTELVNIALSVNAAKFSNSVTVASAVGFSVGDIVKISSTEDFSTDTKKGEYLKISKISSNTLFFHETLQQSFTAATSRVIKYNFAKDITVLGLSTIGRGTIDDPAGINERALMFRGVENLVVRDCKASNFDRMGILFGDTYNATIDSCVINMAQRFNDVYEYIQYGIAILDGQRHTKVTNNVIIGGKHGIAFTGYTGDGVAVDAAVSSNLIQGTWASGFATHMTNLEADVHNNKIKDCGGGFDIRVPQLRIYNNKVSRVRDSFIFIRGITSDLDIYDNKFEDALWGIRTMPAEVLAGSLKNLNIKDNYIGNVAQRGIVLEAGASSGITGVKITGNEIIDIAGDNIRLVGGFVNPYISENNHSFVSRTALGFGVFLSDTNGATISKNHFDSISCVRLDSLTLPAINTKLIGNTYTKKAALISAAAGTTTGLIRQDNKLIATNIVSADSGTVDYPNGALYMQVYSSAAVDLTTVTVGTIGDVVTISRTTGSGFVITLKDNTGNLRLASDFLLSGINDTITLAFNGTYWIEISRSVNG